MKSKHPTGRSLRDEGMEKVLLKSRIWRGEAEAVLRTLAAKGTPFNFDDIHEFTGPPPCHPNIIGAIMNKAVRDKLITHIGYRQTTRPEGHARHVKVYQGIKR